MAWIIPAVTALYGAYEGHQTANAQRDAARASGRGGDFSSSNDPWGPTIPMRVEGLNTAQNLFQNYSPQFNPYRPGGGGPSRQQQQLAQLLIDRARNGTGPVNAGEDFLSNLLGGVDFQGGQAQNADSAYNPMLFNLWNQGAPQNSYLKSFLDQHINDPSFTGGAGAEGSDPQHPVGPLSSEEYLNKVLGGAYLDQGNPHAQNIVDIANRAATKGYTEQAIPGINSAANSLGRFGSGAWSQLQSNAAQSWQQTLADQASKIFFDQYAFERGQQGDASRTLAGVDVAKMNEEGQRFNSDRAMNANNLQALMSAIGQYSGDQQFGASYLGNIAQQYSNDLLGGTGLVPGINQAGLANIQGGLQAQRGLDQQRAAARDRQRQYDIAKWNFEQELPFNQLSNYGRFIDMFGGGFGTTHGNAPGNAQVYTGPSPGGAAIGGALQGWQTGQDIYGLWNQYRQQQSLNQGNLRPPPASNGGNWS